MTLDDFLKRADGLITDFATMMSHAYQDGFHRSWVPAGQFAQLRAASLSFVRNVYGAEHSYYTEFDVKCKDPVLEHAKAGQGVLQAIRDELSGGWTRTTTGLVSSAIFADFLEMAAHLLDEGYKDAAAVIAGSTLEEHLRQLAEMHGIPVEWSDRARFIPKKAEVLNGELAVAKAYEKLDQKSVTAWLDLRNKAAHGHYDKYAVEQVRLMIDGVRDFFVRVPV